MSEFSTQVTIDAPADEVFAFVTDFNNLPQYLPTLKEATPAGEGQIRLQGTAEARHYDAIGWYQIHEFNRTMLWGAKSDDHYSGDMGVADQGNSCSLSINLRFSIVPTMSEADKVKLAAHETDIQEDLDRAGQKIKTVCESAATPSKAKSHGYVG